MKRHARWVRTMFVILAVAGIASIARAEETAAAEAGHKLFERNCAVCHGALGRGDGPLAEDLKVHPADLTTIAKRRGGSFPDAEISELIDGRRRVRGHGNEMPVWGRAFAEQTADPAERAAAVRERIAELVAYLRSIQASTQGAGGDR